MIPKALIQSYRKDKQMRKVLLNNPKLTGTCQFWAPEPFILWKDKYYHIFFFWLQSCRFIKKEGKVLSASKCAIYYFLGNIAQSKSIFISVMNMVDILSVHCTAVLMMLTGANQKHAPFNFVVPLLYQHAVQVFDNLNIGHNGHKWVSKIQDDTL